MSDPELFPNGRVVLQAANKPMMANSKVVCFMRLKVCCLRLGLYAVVAFGAQLLHLPVKEVKDILFGARS